MSKKCNVATPGLLPTVPLDIGDEDVLASCDRFPLGTRSKSSEDAASVLARDLGTEDWRRKRKIKMKTKALSGRIIGV